MTYQVEPDGFATVPGLLQGTEREDLLTACGGVEGAGKRGLLAVPEVAAFARSLKLLALVETWLPRPVHPVRAILFDKTLATNWLVPWHQDLTLALAETGNAPGFGPWSVKEGIPHVQPPMTLLEQMLTVRVHLDPAGRENGGLRVLPGSHRHGRLTATQITEWRARTPEVLCEAATGDALLMRPLLLHASSRSTGGDHRRVLHLEYAGFSLPPGLRWHGT